MALLKFRGIYLEDFEQLEVKDPDTRYIVYNEDGSFYGEFIGEDKVTVEVDLNAMAYFNYAGSIYGEKYSLLASAWKHSLTVDPLRISESSEGSGRAQYPNGETEGVIIPHGVTSIGNRAFYNWRSNSQPLVIPNSVESIGRDAFSYWRSNNQLLVIPNSVTRIEQYAFYEWQSNSQPLVIPSSVTSIGLYAFAHWTSNNQPLVISSSVVAIGESAFYNWTSNSHPLVIPSGVTSIKWGAFRNWELVPYIEMQRITPPTLASASAFSGQNDAPIYVPDGSVEAYKTATNWVDLADRIFGISERR